MRLSATEGTGFLHGALSDCIRSFGNCGVSEFYWAIISETAEFLNITGI
jgi:hypothetical protein